MPSPSWPAVLIGAALVGALLGAVQPPEQGPAATDVAAAPSPSPTAGPVQAEPTGSPDAADPRQPPEDEPDQAGSPTPTADAASGAGPDSAGVDPWPAAVRTTIRTDGLQVALTFDDGPHPRWTPAVLDELARHGVTATFCVVGDQVPGNEALVERIVADGHVLCNHTMSHDYGLPVREPDRIRAEIADLADQLDRIVPEADVTVFRAPGGRFADPVITAADAEGLTPWGWSIDPRDWQADGSEAAAGAIVTTVLDQIGPGAVVLLHDGGGDRQATVAALAELVPLLQSVGYEFVGLAGS